MMRTFSQVETDQFSSLFERYNTRAKNMQLSLCLYTKICKLNIRLIEVMTCQKMNIPANELTKCSVMQLALPAFLHTMSS
jgi:hypothetical protein